MLAAQGSPELGVWRDSEGLGAPSEAMPGSHCPSAGPDLALCHHVPPRTAESPAVTYPAGAHLQGMLLYKQNPPDVLEHFISRVAPSQFHGDRAGPKG